MRPNIIYLNSHDTGRWIQPYGHPVPTPHLQRLAEEGVLFRRAFSAAPTCSPSRAALTTGRTPHEAGMTGLAHRGFSLRDPRRHLSHVLRGAGYRTALAGLQHVSRDPDAELGYDERLSPEGHGAEEASLAAAEFLRREHDRPFYLEIGTFETHRPFPAPSPQDDPRYLRPPGPVPDAPETREDMAGYLASVRRFDEGVGRVLEALEDSGRAEDTLVLCTTDHGLAFPGMKCTLSDDGTGVMLLMRGPGGFRGGVVSEALVSQLDLYPTLCELAGVAAEEGLRGRSLLPLMDGTVQRIREEVFAELTYHVDYQPQRSIRTDRHRYVRSYRHLEARLLAHTDDGPSKRHLVEHGWGERAPAQEMLFDLLDDPDECENRIEDPALADVARELRGRLEQWMRETEDPLRDGPVPAPPGADVQGAP
jgi:arylsulfatase A-like enzyme